MSSPEATDPEEAGPADAGRPASRWAIAAFLLGLVSLVPLSVIAGIVALVRTRDGRESGRGLAIAGMVISILWGAVWAYSAWPKEGLITGTLQSGPMLRVGDCFGETINSPVSCDKPHSREVFAVLSLSRFPDNDTEQEQLENRCKAELPKFSAAASRDPELRVEAWPPGTESRYMDNHVAECLRISVPTGSVRLRAERSGFSVVERQRFSGDHWHPSGTHIDGVALLQPERFGIAPGDLSSERPAGGGIGQFHPHLEAEHHHTIDGGPDHAGGLRDAVVGSELHIRTTANPDVVRADQNPVQ